MSNKIVIEVNDLNFWYKKTQALENIKLKIMANEVTTIIGSSGCGKSTLIRCFNRMNDLIPKTVVEGKILFHEKNIYHRKQNVNKLRVRIGMVFQKNNCFPMSVYDNIAYGPRSHGIKDKKTLDKIIKKSLKNVGLWEDVKNSLDESALDFSGGQQQRICIARTLAMEPEVILMDEPTSALDILSTEQIEELILKLKKEYTIILVTHSIKQAKRVSDNIVFMHKGKIREFSKKDAFFENPKSSLAKKIIKRGLL